MDYLGTFDVNSTVRILFTTHAQTGAAIAPLTAFEAADVILYKNGSATQRSSTSGWTMTSPFDAIVGLHQIAFDLSDNTDAGFYAAGSEYVAILSPDTETVDGLVVIRVLGSFSIERVSKVNVTAMAAGVITAAVIATGAVDADALAADAVDEIWAKALSDLAAVPGATATVLAALNWLFELARNKRTETAALEVVYKDDSLTALASSAKSDDTVTFTTGKYA